MAALQATIADGGAMETTLSALEQKQNAHHKDTMSRLQLSNQGQYLKYNDPWTSGFHILYEMRLWVVELQYFDE